MINAYREVEIQTGPVMHPFQKKNDVTFKWCTKSLKKKRLKQKKHNSWTQYVHSNNNKC